MALPFFSSLASWDEKYNTCLFVFLYMTPLGSDSFTINCQTAFNEEYLNYLVDGDSHSANDHLKYSCR